MYELFHIYLISNFTMTRKRLNNLQHALKGEHPELIYKYNEQLVDQPKRGFIEQVLDPNIHQGVIHYIPHFPVFKESSTTAMRIVHDASAKISSKALSLNDCLHTRPNLIQRLQNMLLTFRSQKIAFTADVYRKGVPTNRAQHSRQGCYEIPLAQRWSQTSE